MTDPVKPPKAPKPLSVKARLDAMQIELQGHKAALATREDQLAERGNELRGALDTIALLRKELVGAQSVVAARDQDLQDTVARVVKLKKELDAAQTEAERGRTAIRSEAELTRQAQSWKVRAQGLETRLRDAEEVSHSYSQNYGISPRLNHYRAKWGGGKH